MNVTNRWPLGWSSIFAGSKIVALLALVSLCLTASPVLADEPEDEPLEIRMYQVGDLVDRNPSRPFTGFSLPGISDQGQPFLMGRGGPNGGGNMYTPSGGGGTSGGGVFSISPALALPAAQFGGGGGLGGGQWVLGSQGAYSGYVSPVQNLIEVILTCVEDHTWRQSGGPGQIASLGNILIVTQTKAVHDQIGSFLDVLRQTGNANSSPVTIRAVWLTVDEAQLQMLKVKRNQSVDRDVLNQLVKEQGRRGSVSCFSGQTVHIAAGNLKSAVESVIPVVGQIDREDVVPTAIVNHPPDATIDSADNELVNDDAAKPNRVKAQLVATLASPELEELVSAAPQERGVGYQPVLRWINFGAVLEVTPEVNTDERKIHLDLSSVVVLPKTGDQRVTNPVTGPDLELANVRCQQFSATVQINDSTPTLVGGSTIEAEDGTPQQTWLIVEAILGEE